jgi:cellulose biosynthesis protein BcsQ
MTDIIAVASSKGGVGKTTTTFSLAAAAARRGSVLAIDLDPSISLTTQMQVPITGPTIEEVVTGRAALEDSIWTSKEGILVIPGSRTLYQVDIKQEQLRGVLEPALALVDTVIIDTRPALETLHVPMLLASKVVIPTYLDGVSLPVTADTIYGVLQAGVADKVSGILATNVRRPLTKLAKDLYASLQVSGVGYEAVVWNTTQWPQALASGGLAEYPDLLAAAEAILDETLRRACTWTALKKYADAWRKSH